MRQRGATALVAALGAAFWTGACTSNNAMTDTGTNEEVAETADPGAETAAETGDPGAEAIAEPTPETSEPAIEAIAETNMSSASCVGVAWNS